MVAQLNSGNPIVNSTTTPGELAGTASASDSAAEIAAQDSVVGLANMMTGSKQLQNEPGVLYGLQQAQADPSQAHEIDQFMQSLDAEKQVRLARMNGQKINLSSGQQGMLTQNGIGFDDVIETAQDHATTISAHILKSSDGQLTAKKNPDGSLALDSKGQVLTERVSAKDSVPHGHSGGMFSSVGAFFGGVAHGAETGLKDAGKGVLTGVTKAWNFAQSAVSVGTSDPASLDQDMKASGYNPDSFWSKLAFRSSGHEHIDVSDLDKQYKTDHVDMALQYTKDPEAYQKGLINDPGNYVQDADGKPVADAAGNLKMTPAGIAKWKYLRSDEFNTLVLKLNARDATIGNLFAAGIDPVKHPKAFTLTAAGTNLAASFLIDPTNAALGGLKIAKMAAVGIDTAGDASRPASILLRQSHLPWVNNVQRGWKKAIDYGKQIREANAAGDTETVAKVSAKFNAELPGLSPLMESFTGGEHVYLGVKPGAEVFDKFGHAHPVLEFGHSDGIQDMVQAADFVGSKAGLVRLSNGRAAVQSSLMPGAISGFGYRLLKGKGAAALAGHAAGVSDSRFSYALNAADKDTKLGDRLVSQGMLVRLMPQADDAVSAEGTVLASKLSDDPTMLLSQKRAYALTAAGKGDIALNVRKTGRVLGDLDPSTGVGATLKSLAARKAARMSLASHRFDQLLPRSQTLHINGAQTSTLIRQHALTYLNRYDANMLAVMFNAGDATARKAIILGVRDQVNHAAGLATTKTGRDLMDRLEAEGQTYAAAPNNEIVLDGRKVALLPGETRPDWTIPKFRDLQHASAKITLWENTMGRAMSSTAADKAMDLWKIMTLLAPRTAVRNLVEGWLHIGVNGDLGAAVKARALLTTPNEELWAKGLDLQSPARADYLRAQATNDQDLAHKIAKGNRLSGPLTGRTKAGQWLVERTVLALTAHTWRNLVGRNMTDEEVKAFLTLSHDDLGAMLEGFNKSVLENELGSARSAKASTEIAGAGYAPSSLRHSVHAAYRSTDPVTNPGPATWTVQSLDDAEGATRFANALGVRVNQAPETARAIIARLGDPEASEDNRAIIAAMEKEGGLTGFGRVFFPDIDGAPEQARRAVTPDEVALGKHDWSNKLVAEYKHLLTGQNGVYQKDLADYITTTGHAPDGEWLTSHLGNANRPDAMMSPDVMAMPPGGPRNLVSVLQDAGGAGYQHFVINPLLRTTTAPAHLTYYIKARIGLNGRVEEMVKSGISRPAADNWAREDAIKSAWVKAESTIDDPGQRTQFDIIARNLFPFARAEQAMVRRWATGLWQNPQKARQLMLGYESAVQGGIIYDNAYGEPTFTYPGSGVMGDLMQQISKLPGMGNLAQFPVASSMTGQVLMSVPGAENPLRIGAGPMLAMPVREIYKNLLPTAWQGDAVKFDAWFNGPAGAGDTSLSSLMPSVVRKAINAFSPADRNKAMAAATKSAFANLAAAGLVPGPDATDLQVQKFRGRLQDQVRSQLAVGFILGLFSPTSPSAPTEQTSGSKPDFAWAGGGVNGLSDEYKRILSEAGGDVGKANAVFTTLHPDDVVYKGLGGKQVTKLPSSAYETSQSQPVAHGAYLPSTEAALKWLDNHGTLINNYSGLAAYFLPAGDGKDPFSDSAYQAQLELGLRVRKTPEEFMNDVYVKHSESSYYAQSDEIDGKIAAAAQAGNKPLQKQLTQLKSEWKTEYMSLNTALRHKMAGFGPARDHALQQVTNLRQMVKANDVPNGSGPLLHQLLQNYDGYNTYRHQFPGTDKQSTAKKSAALAVFNGWVDQNITPQSGLQSVYNGVFRPINSHFDRAEDGE